MTEHPCTTSASTLRTWINTGMHKQVWKAIGKKGDYARYDWTTEADADAVFIPERHSTYVRSIEIFPTAFY